MVEVRFGLKGSWPPSPHSGVGVGSLVLTLQTAEYCGGARPGHAVGEALGTQILLCKLLKHALLGLQQFWEEALGRQLQQIGSSLWLRWVAEACPRLSPVNGKYAAQAACLPSPRHLNSLLSKNLHSSLSPCYQCGVFGPVIRSELWPPLSCSLGSIDSSALIS